MICFERRISSFHWYSMWKGWMWRITQPLTRWPSQRNSCASCMSTELPATSPWWAPSRVIPKSQGGHLDCFGCRAIGKGVRRGFNPSTGGDGDTLRALIPPHCTLRLARPEEGCEREGACFCWSGLRYWESSSGLCWWGVLEFFTVWRSDCKEPVPSSTDSLSVVLEVCLLTSMRHWKTVRKKVLGCGRAFSTHMENDSEILRL